MNLSAVANANECRLIALDVLTRHHVAVLQHKRRIKQAALLFLWVGMNLLGKLSELQVLQLVCCSGPEVQPHGGYRLRSCHSCYHEEACPA